MRSRASEADTTHFKGEICIRARSGQIAVLILELEVGRAFTTLPVSPLVDPQAWQKTPLQSPTAFWVRQSGRAGGRGIGAPTRR